MATDATPRVDAREARRVAEQARETQWRAPSFAKDLYLGRFRLGAIHPHPQQNPEVRAREYAFLVELRRVCEKELDGTVIEHDAMVPDEYVRKLNELGVFGMKIEQEYGGLGLSQLAYHRALMLIGSVHPSLVALVSAHQSIGVPQPVKMFGTPEQKKEYLTRCAQGAISAFLLTEPDVGSDPARLAATATPVDDGDAYELSGVKLWTTNGVVAELLVVMARVPEYDYGPGGVTAFVVEGDSPGITVEQRNAFMGLRGIENGVTRFDRVRVPAQNRLGREGDGLKIALTTLNAGRLSIPATGTASTKWALKIAREWSNERVQWGVPVGKHAAVAHKIAFIAGTAFAQEAVLELTSLLADHGKHDIRIEAALAKLWSSEMAWLAVDELVQIRGGRGYESAESLRARGERAVPAEQILRDLRINRIFEGSSEIMHLLIAREAVDTHLKAAGALADPDSALGDKAASAAKASGFYARWLPTLAFGRGHVPGAYGEFGVLATHMRFIERRSRKLARQTFYGMARWQAGLERKQGFLSRIVDIGAELFAMAASCTRAQMLRSEGPDGEHAAELADLFCRQARLRVDRLFDELWSNTDRVDEKVVKKILNGEHLWFEDDVLDVSAGTGPWIATQDGEPAPNVARRFL